MLRCFVTVYTCSRSWAASKARMPRGTRPMLSSSELKDVASDHPSSQDVHGNTALKNCVLLSLSGHTGSPAARAPKLQPMMKASWGRRRRPEQNVKSRKKCVKSLPLPHAAATSQKHARALAASNSNKQTIFYTSRRWGGFPIHARTSKHAGPNAIKAHSGRRTRKHSNRSTGCSIYADDTTS